MGSNTDMQNESDGRVAKQDGAISGIIVLRLIAAALIFAVSLIINMPEFLTVLLLIIAAAAAGYDIALSAVNSIEEGDYFATPVILLLVAVVSFVIGVAYEGVAMLVLYQVGNLFIAYASARTKTSAVELLRYQDEETVSRVISSIGEDDAGKTDLESSVSYAASSVLKLAMIFAVIFAVAVPLITNISFKEAIHRAMMILVVSTPMSVVVAMPLTGIVGLCHGGQYGVIFNKAATMEAAANVKTAVFDKAGIFTAECPRLISIQSDVLDKKTFMTFAAHALYYSDQPVSKAVASSADIDYKLELISDFKEIPGGGVELKIGGAQVVLATREIFADRGEAIPYESNRDYLYYYMMISGKYVGKLVLSNEFKAEAENIAPGMRAVGIEKCVLLSEDSREDTENAAALLEFDEAYGECDTNKKLNILSNICSGTENNQVLYVYSSGIEAHSAAGIDVRVSRKGKYADILVLPDYAENIPAALKLCYRMLQVSSFNAIFAFAVKALLIFLSIIGYSSIWFVIFIDMAAALATILNSIRVSSDSLIEILLYKAEK